MSELHCEMAYNRFVIKAPFKTQLEHFSQDGLTQIFMRMGANTTPMWFFGLGMHVIASVELKFSDFSLMVVGILEKLL